MSKACGHHSPTALLGDGRPSGGVKPQAGPNAGKENEMDTDRWMDMIVRHLIKMQLQMEWEVYVEAWEELLRLQSQRLNSHDYGLVHRYA